MIGKIARIVKMYYDIQIMPENSSSQANSKNELSEKLKNLLVERQQVKEQIRETEKQIDHLQNNTSQSG
ncbi:hypothetical protein [Phormidesmis sp. 146-33]